eukprot:357794-Chlamydomonas_euryale.AAC.10
MLSCSCSPPIYAYDPVIYVIYVIYVISRPKIYGSCQPYVYVPIYCITCSVVYDVRTSQILVAGSWQATSRHEHMFMLGVPQIGSVVMVLFFSNVGQTHRPDRPQPKPASAPQQVKRIRGN